MDKKEALVMLLQNSFIVSDIEKKKILNRLASLTADQVDTLGTLLAREQKQIVERKDTIFKQAKLLLNTLELISE